MAVPKSCSVEYVGDISKDHYLVTYSNGVLRMPTNEDATFKAYENTETRDRFVRRFHRKILVSSTDKMDYVGYNFGSHGPRFGNLCKYFVGILDKNTGKMRVHDAEFYNLQPYLTENVNEAESDETEEDKKTFMEKISKLTTAFGSKKRKQNLEQRLHRKVDDKALISMLSSVGPYVENAKQLLKDGEKYEHPVQTETELIPPQNKNAVIPKDVYDVRDIITEEENAALETEAAELAQITREQIDIWRKEKKYSEYVLGYLERTPDFKLGLEKAKLLKYYSYMITLYKLKWNEVKKKDPLPNVPNPFKSNLLSKFTLTSTNENGRSNRTMPERMKEKILAHAFVLVLFLEQFSVNIKYLMPDFCIKPNRLSSIANALGCHVTAKKLKVSNHPVVTNTAELKIPLFVIEQKKMFRKGKRK